MNSLTTLSDDILISDYLKTNDAKLYGELYNRYHKKVFLYCHKILRNKDNALDVTQDLFIKISNKLDQLNESKAFHKWLFRVAHNECIDFLRRNKKTIHYTIDSSFELSNDHDIAIKLESDRKEMQFEKMDIALSKLKEIDKSMLVEKYIGNKTLKDLMTKYGLSESATKMRLARSRTRARKLCLAN